MNIAQTSHLAYEPHIPDAPLAQLDRALPSEAEGQALNWLRKTGIEVRRFSELAKFGERT